MKSKDDFAQNTNIRKLILVPNVASDLSSGFWIEEQKLSSNLKIFKLKQEMKNQRNSYWFLKKRNYHSNSNVTKKHIFGFKKENNLNSNLIVCTGLFKRLQ